jgi:hypothetical protein
MSNIERYQKDLDALIARGERLHVAMQSEYLPELSKEAVISGSVPKDAVSNLPSFAYGYQHGTQRRRP